MLRNSFLRGIHFLALLGLAFSLAGCGGGGSSISYTMPGAALTMDTAQPTLIDITGLSASQPKKVALLLPLSGNLARSGQAVRNGFLAAYYYAKSKSVQVPNIKVYNTATSDSRVLYSKAVADGADFVVGPLTKPKVGQLVSSAGSLSVPVLALNTLSNYQSNVVDNLYQFGLSPEDEVLQMAVHAYKNGASSVLLIAPDTSWGRNLAGVLATNFTGHGGTIVDGLYYTQANLAKQLNDFLTTDVSRDRALNLRRLLHENVKYKIRRRQDFDAVFLIATPGQARQIRPLLRFYYAGKIPVYATSLIYNGETNKRVNQDLNGITFCDMPWVLMPPAALPDYLQAANQQINALWSNKRGKYNKLYALGVDAYNLLGYLYGQVSFPSNGIFGATGSLYLDQYQHIYRRVKWAHFVDGEAVLNN